MKAAAGFLFFLKSPFVLFLFCIIDHKLADFEKKNFCCDTPAKPTFYRFQNYSWMTLLSPSPKFFEN